MCLRPIKPDHDGVYSEEIRKLGRKEERLMPIVTMSHQAFDSAGELAQQISNVLGYRLVSRDDIVEKTAQYGISKDRQGRARGRRLGILRRMDPGWRRYRIYSQAALTKEIRKGCLVYLGENGLARFRDFPNVFNIQVRTDIEHRIDNLMKRAEHSLNWNKAENLIKKADDREARWRNTFYTDGQMRSSEFDLVIKLGQIGINDACDLISSTMEQKEYQTTYKSLEVIDLLTVAAELRARIAMNDDVMDDDIDVAVHDGVIVVKGYVRSTENLDSIRELID